MMSPSKITESQVTLHAAIASGIDLEESLCAALQEAGVPGLAAMELAPELLAAANAMEACALDVRVWLSDRPAHEITSAAFCRWYKANVLRQRDGLLATAAALAIGEEA